MSLPLFALVMAAAESAVGVGLLTMLRPTRADRAFGWLFLALGGLLGVMGWTA